MDTTETNRMGRFRRVLASTAKWGGLGFVTLLTLGATYQAVATASDRSRFPAPGRLVEVDGARMHIDCVGRGQPTVILDAGNGGLVSTWAWIQPELAGHTRVCAYDRAGLGWSEPTGSPRNAVTIAHELKALLDAADESGPYVHVGHSLAGIYGRVFAAEFPAEVAGLVLVDASHPQQFERFPEEIVRRMTIFNRLMQVAPMAARFGIIRATNLYGRMAKGLPEADYARASAMTARPVSVRTTNAEFAAWAANAERLAGETDLGDLPLAVVTAGLVPGAPAGLIDAHFASQRELAQLSRRSRIELLPEADHLTILTERDQATLASAVIRDLVATVRTDLGLTMERHDG